MNHPDYNSPVALKAFLESRNMAMQKKFGQNFMINEDARRKIAGALELSENDSLWEVGPGLGCMTEIFLEQKADVTVFEIDRGFINCIQEFFNEESEKGRFRIVAGDVLKNWKKTYDSLPQEKKSALKLAGNLPYNIAATFIADTVAEEVIFDRCVFTVQKEVVQRMCAKPSTKNYSSFSVLCQHRYDVTAGRELGPGNFWPRPNVDSQSVTLIKKQSYDECDSRTFVKLVHALFSSRRKTVLNNIKNVLKPGMDAASLFTAAGIDPSSRAENLSCSDFARLSRAFCSDIME